MLQRQRCPTGLVGHAKDDYFVFRRYMILLLKDYEQKQNMIERGPHCVLPQDKFRAGTQEPDDPTLWGTKQGQVLSWRKIFVWDPATTEPQNVLDNWPPTHHPDGFINQLFKRSTFSI